MTQTFTKTKTYTVICCASCKIEFGITEAADSRFREKGTSFYCPNGHSLSYSNNEISRLKAEIEAKNQELTRKTRLLEFTEAKKVEAQKEAEHHKRSAAITRGRHRAMKAKIAAGLCPCCRRRFANLMRHMQHQHPDFNAKEDA